MKKRAKECKLVGMRKVFGLSYCGLLLIMASCGVNEIRDRKLTLERLLATNAPLTAVEAAIGQIPVYKPGGSEWKELRTYYARHPKAWYNQHLVEEIDRASSFGWTSTMTMQTWIFLDDKDRLIGFEVGSQ